MKAGNFFLQLISFQTLALEMEMFGADEVQLVGEFDFRVWC